MRESKIQAEIRLALAARRDNVFWRNQVGRALYYKDGHLCPQCGKPTLGAREYYVPYGLCPGSSDLIGLVTVPALPFAVFAGLEVKAKRGVESEDQQEFRQLVRARGGVVQVVRSAEEADQVVESITRKW
jgi:hypothetical protein